MMHPLNLETITTTQSGTIQNGNMTDNYGSGDVFTVSNLLNNLATETITTTQDGTV